MIPLKISIEWHESERGKGLTPKPIKRVQPEN